MICVYTQDWRDEQKSSACAMYYARLASSKGCSKRAMQILPPASSVSCTRTSEAALVSQAKGLTAESCTEAQPRQRPALEHPALA